MASTDPIERSKQWARKRYPQADVSTRNIRGRPIVLATTDNLIRPTGRDPIAADFSTALNVRLRPPALWRPDRTGEAS